MVCLSMIYILNQFQKGQSHMAVVVQFRDDIRETAENAKATAGILEISIHSNPTHVQEELKGKFVASKVYYIMFSENGNLSKEEVKSLPILDEEIVGIITLEDVMEELLRVSMFIYQSLILQGQLLILEFSFCRGKYLIKLINTSILSQISSYITRFKFTCLSIQ